MNVAIPYNILHVQLKKQKNSLDAVGFVMNVTPTGVNSFCIIAALLQQWAGVAAGWCTWDSLKMIIVTKVHDALV